MSARVSTAEGGGRLVLAGAPLGRVSDASPGLAAALQSADVIAAEDTRRLYRLAAALGITMTARVVSYYDAVETARVPALLDRLAAGDVVLLVTDAGMPCVSDPGYRLVSAAAAAGHQVTAVPGPSAVTTALALSGLPSDRFCFEGFLPRTAGARARALASLADEPRTMVFFESVHRLEATLAAMIAAFGAVRPAVLARELTKTYEQVLRGSLAGLLDDVAGVRGEVTLVVAGRPAPALATSPAAGPTAADPASAVDAEMATGLSRRDAIEAVADQLGLTRRVVYQAAVARP